MNLESSSILVPVIPREINVRLSDNKVFKSRQAALTNPVLNAVI